MATLLLDQSCAVRYLDPMAAGPTKKDVLVAWLGGALIGTIVGFNAGIYTGLGVLVPARDRRDKQTVVTVLGISSGVIGLAIWGTWTVRLCLFFASLL